MKITLDKKPYEQLKEHLGQQPFLDSEEKVADQKGFTINKIVSMLRSDRTEDHNTSAELFIQDKNDETRIVEYHYLRQELEAIVPPDTYLYLEPLADDELETAMTAFREAVKNQLLIEPSDVFYAFDDTGNVSTLIDSNSIQDLWQPQGEYTNIHLVSADGQVTDGISSPSALYMGRTNIRVHLKGAPNS